ncbi:hypothetical protein O3M35_000043 [Rhynocoris fuscipes]|uniref:RING-type domain-containing protein n=1 Tax=Rhynocoris fuscipes TaxID=488301 RepID=A0AAW1DQU5_9HEMI
MNNICWVFCTKCFNKPSQSSRRKFLITSCSHVFCDHCANIDDSQCPRCQAACRMIFINNEMPDEVKDVFLDVTEKVNMVFKAMEFQEWHRARLLNHYRAIAQKYEAAKVYIKDAENKFVNLKNKYDAAKLKINNQENIIQDLNRKLNFYKQKFGTRPLSNSQPLTELNFEVITAVKASRTPSSSSSKLQIPQPSNPLLTPTYSMYRNAYHPSVTTPDSSGSVRSSQFGSMGSYSGRNRSLPGFTPPSKTMELLTLLNKSRSQK